MINIEDLLNKYNLIRAKSALAKNVKKAINIANTIGYPVALKIESKDILHKTDVGGVILNLSNEKEVHNAFQNITRSVNVNKPDAIIEGIIVQEMIPSGIEIIIGFNSNPIFGPALMLGLGGIFTEVIKDVVFRILPIKPADAGKMIKELRYSDLVLKGYRGVPGVSRELLVDIICKIAKLVLELYPEIDSFDINPLIMWGDNYRIVDFKYTTSDKVTKIVSKKPDISYLNNFFKAKSVAVIGASGASNKLGNYILNSIAFHDYNGKVYPINPNHSSIMGIKSYPSLVDVPENIDMVVITIPLSGVMPILEQCRGKNIHNMVIVSAGGKETGNKELEENIKKKAKEYQIRIIGCNCIGVMNGYSRLDTFFYPDNKVIKPGSGNISMLTQSGTVGVAFLEKITKYGISKFISYGNRMDVDEGDLIEYLSKDYKTKVIAVYVESFEKGAKFYRSAKKISGKKPVVIYKAGRSQESSNLSKSHTGFLSESFNLALSVFNQANIISVDSLEALVASSKILSRFEKVNGGGIMVITNGAGAVIQAMDKMEQNKKLKLVDISGGFKKRLVSKLPPYAVIDKIIDLTGSSSDSDYKTAIDECYNNKDIDIVMVWLMLQNPFISEEFYLLFKDFIKNNKKPVIVGAAGEEYTRKIGSQIEDLGIPVFYTVDDWVAAAEAISK